MVYLVSRLRASDLQVFYSDAEFRIEARRQTRTAGLSKTTMLAQVICVFLLTLTETQGSIQAPCPGRCAAQCAPSCSPQCCQGYGAQTYPSYQARSYYPRAPYVPPYPPRPQPLQMYIPPPPPPPPPPQSYFIRPPSPPAYLPMSFPPPRPPPPPPPPSCPGACPNKCFPACVRSCCSPPPPPPCPWYCSDSCYPQCTPTCCKPKPPPMPLYLKRSEKSAVACEEHKLKLQCPNKFDRIVLYSTFYGRKKDNICHHDFIPSKGHCADQEMLVNKKVYDLCGGENKCSVSATNKFLSAGNNTLCPGLYKYLKVVYRCHQHPKIFPVCPLPCHNPYQCFPHCTPDCCTPPPPPPKTCPGLCSRSCAPLCSRSCCNPAPPPPPPPPPPQYYRPPSPPMYMPQPQPMYMPPPPLPPPRPPVYMPSTRGCPAPCPTSCAPTCSPSCCSPQTPQYYPGREVTAPAPPYLKLSPPTSAKAQQNQLQFPRPQPYTFSTGYSSFGQTCPGPCSNACAPICSRSCCYTRNRNRNWRRTFGMMG